MKQRIMKHNIFTILALLALVVVPACKSLEVPPPNSLTDEQMQQILAGDDENAKAMIIAAIGNTLNSNFNAAGATWSGYSSYPLNSQVDQDFLMSMRGNDVIPGTDVTGKSGHAATYRTFENFDARNLTWPYYALGALLTTNANKVLLYVTEDAGKTGGSAAQFRGQALCVRAYAYMQLMERFQKAYTNGGKDGKGMPIYTAYKVNTPAPISSAEETYEFILGDLKEAVQLLEEMGYTSELKDIDLGVARFLYARAALWAGEWDVVIEQAGKLTEQFKTFIKEENYGAKAADLRAYCEGTKDLKAEDNAFQTLGKNPEAIMGFVQGDGSNTYQNLFCNVFEPGEAGEGGLAPRIEDRLYDKIDPRDFRKDIFTTEAANYVYIIDEDGKTQMREIPPYANLKWAATIAKGYDKRSHHLECDNYIFRSSEAYLMLAEAYAQKGNDSQAKATLNKLLAARTKAGEAALTCDTYSGMSGLNALQMVQLQTRIELWCENGREFYNNKRWNIPVNRSGSKVHYSNASLAPEAMVLQVPINETSTNTHWAD